MIIFLSMAGSSPYQQARADDGKKEVTLVFVNQSNKVYVSKLPEMPLCYVTGLLTEAAIRKEGG